MLGKELPLGLILAILSLELAKVNDTGDALAELGGELF